VPVQKPNWGSGALHLPQIQRGIDQRGRHAWAVPAAVDQDHAVVAALVAELVDLVVEHELVAQGRGRQLEMLGFDWV
jgi:hypothetical protein